MSTIIDQAVTAIVAALQSAPAVAASIGRVSLRPAAANAPQLVVVRPVQSDPMDFSSVTAYPVAWSTSIAVECYARSTGTIAPDQSVDSLLESVYSRLMQDPTLGNALVSLEPKQLNYDFDADGEKTACATLVFAAFHRATAGLLS